MLPMASNKSLGYAELSPIKDKTCQTMRVHPIARPNENERYDGIYVTPLDGRVGDALEMLCYVNNGGVITLQTV